MNKIELFVTTYFNKVKNYYMIQLKNEYNDEYISYLKNEIIDLNICIKKLMIYNLSILSPSDKLSAELYLMSLYEENKYLYINTIETLQYYYLYNFIEYFIRYLKNVNIIYDDTSFLKISDIIVFPEDNNYSFDILI